MKMIENLTAHEKIQDFWKNKKNERDAKVKEKFDSKDFERI